MKRQKSKENDDPNKQADKSQEVLLRRKKNFRLVDSPFPPNDIDAKSSELLTQCRHCSWYSFFWHGNFSAMKRCHATKELVPDIRPPSCTDWCHYCGRVASDNDLEKQLGTISPYFRHDLTSTNQYAVTHEFRNP